MTLEEQITEFLKAQNRQPDLSKYYDPEGGPLRNRRDYTTVARKTLPEELVVVETKPEEVKVHE